MAETKIGCQFYTLRDFLKTPEDIARTLVKVNKAGYKAVQLSAVGPIEPKELKKICDGEGLEICSTHISPEQLRNDMKLVIQQHNIWDCKNVAIGGIPQEYKSGEGYKKFAKVASKWARTLKKEGMTFSYHNHHFELERYNGKTGLEILYDESEKEFLFEIDTYWIQFGGGDPVYWINRMKGREVLVHFKDLGVIDMKQVMFEVGEGNLNWKSILKACKDAKIEWHLVEQDTCQRNPFESVEISLKNLNKMGLK